MNLDGHKDCASDRLEAATKAMASIEVSDVPENAIRRTRRAMRQQLPRFSWSRRSLQGAAAAIIAVVLLLMAFVIAQTNSSLALADVLRKVKATRTLRAVVVDPNGGGTLYVSGKRRRIELDRAIVIADSDTGEQLMLDSRNKSAYQLAPKQMTSALLDYYDMFRQLSAAASTPVDEYTDQAGKKYPGFSGKTALKIGKAKWNVETKLWINPKSKLPVRLEIRPTEGPKWVLLVEQIEFDVPLDDAIFDMTIPHDYAIVGISEDQLEPPLSKQQAAKLTIVPGVGIGDVKFGMSREQIVAVLGEPEFTMHGVYLTYPSKGLQLVLVGHEPDKLGLIIANPSDAASLTRNEFPGQTDNGIRIGSSVEEVRDAYGEPDAPLPNDSRVAIARYNKRGIMFTFVEGKLDQIFVSRTD